MKCGALLPGPAFVADGAGRCPDCRLDLVAHAFGAVGYSECPRCAGLFLRREAFEAVTKDADTRAKVRLAEPPAAVAAPSSAAPAKGASGVSRPSATALPSCAKLMNRSNYGGGWNRPRRVPGARPLVRQGGARGRRRLPREGGLGEGEEEGDPSTGGRGRRAREPGSVWPRASGRLSTPRPAAADWRRCSRSSDRSCGRSPPKRSGCLGPDVPPLLGPAPTDGSILATSRDQRGAHENAHRRAFGPRARSSGARAFRGHPGPASFARPGFRGPHGRQADDHAHPAARGHGGEVDRYRPPLLGNPGAFRRRSSSRPRGRGSSTGRCRPTTFSRSKRKRRATRPTRSAKPGSGARAGCASRETSCRSSKERTRRAQGGSLSSS